MEYYPKKQNTKILADVPTKEIDFQIITRCMVESIPTAFPNAIIPGIQGMQSDFRNMFLQSEFGDVSIFVANKTLRVHKDILIMRCPVFAAMFSQEWREKTTQTVTINGFDYKTILAMIEFIYYGGADDDANHNEEEADPAELLKAAHMYQLNVLIKASVRLSNVYAKN